MKKLLCLLLFSISLLSFVAEAAQQTPFAPHVFKADTSGIILTWNKLQGETRYYIQRSVNGGDWAWLLPAPHYIEASKVRIEPFTGGPSYVDTRIAIGKNYRYRIRAYGSGGMSAFSSLVKVSTAPKNAEWVKLNDAYERNGVYEYKYCANGPYFGGKDCVVEEGWTEGWSHQPRMEYKLKSCNEGFENISGQCATPVKTTTISLGRDNFTACAILNGGLKCWGSKYIGPVNEATYSGRLESPTSFAGLESGVTSVSVGHTHACVVVNKAVKCWGQNKYGELGVNTSTQFSSTPLLVPGTQNASHVVAGRYHTCAIINHGLKCWGLNDSGQLGNNSTTNSFVPVEPAGLNSGVNAVSLGIFNTCAVHNNLVKCWGKNNYQQLGFNMAIKPMVAVPTQVDNYLASGLVVGLLSGVEVSTAANGATQITGEYTCASSSSTLQCWGKNAALGMMSPSLPRSFADPVTRKGLDTRGVTHIAGDSQKFCMIQNSAVKCYGKGLLGDGSPSISAIGLATVKSVGAIPTEITVSGANTCIKVDGGYYCWGSDSFGEAGNGPNQGQTIVPHPLSALSF